MPCGLTFRRKPDPQPEPDWENNLGTILRAMKEKSDDRTAAYNAQFERNRARYEREDREEGRRREDRRRTEGDGRRSERTDRDMREDTAGRHDGPQAVGKRRYGERTHRGGGEAPDRGGEASNGQGGS